MVNQRGSGAVDPLSPVVNAPRWPPRIQDLLSQLLAAGYEDSALKQGEIFRLNQLGKAGSQIKMRNLHGMYRAGNVLEDQVPRRRRDTGAHTPGPILLQNADVKVKRGELQETRLCSPTASEESLKCQHRLDGVLVSNLAAFRRARCTYDRVKGRNSSIRQAYLTCTDSSSRRRAQCRVQIERASMTSHRGHHIRRLRWRWLS